MQPFSKQLKRERRRLGLTQAACAALFGISDRTLGKVENGKSDFSEIEKRGAMSILKRHEKTTAEFNEFMQSIETSTEDQK